MIVFQVASRTAPLAAPPKKRARRLPETWFTVIRVIDSMGISALLFVALLEISHSNYTFVLLPVFLSLLITGSLRYNFYFPGILSLLITGFRRYNLDMFLNSTPLYLLLTICLTLIYYGAITEGILITHYAATVPIILVTTTLAWVIILEPVREYIQSFIERRFNVRNREVIKIIETFTSTLREEIDLEQLRERFLTVIQQSIHPYSVSLGVRMTVHQQEQAGSTKSSEYTVAGDDPLIAYFLRHSGATAIERLQLDSAFLQDLKQRGVEVVLPLASQGELIGLLELGLKLNREDYSHEDRRLLNTLAIQVAPALRVTQMVQEQQIQVREQERIEQELRTAQTIQHAFLPEALPLLAGWQLATYYKPARVVGGDFYDFIPFEDGCLGLVIGDATDKGMPAALVMTTTATMLRTAAQATTSPAEVLARVNELLYARIPARMFVTCFYALLDPTSGRLRYANAGQDLPYRCHGNGVSELWATGMPLGLMPGTGYEEHEVALARGDSILFYSDGLVEAHNSRREMFDTPRLKALLAEHANGASLIDRLLSELKSFTGEGWEQEDDVTLVTLQRASESVVMNEQQADQG